MAQPKSADIQAQVASQHDQHNHHHLDPERGMPTERPAEELGAPPSYGTIVVQREPSPPQVSIATQVKNTCSFGFSLLMAMISFAVFAFVILALFKHMGEAWKDGMM